MENMILLSSDATHFPLFSINPETVLFTLINTLLIVLAYWRFLHKPVSEMFEKRKEAVAAELAVATAAKESALASEKEYKALLADSKTEAGKIIANATKKAREWEEDIITQAKESALQIHQKADEDIERERKRAVNEIKNQITEIVIMAAAAVAEKEISESDNAALIESFLVSAEAVGE
jgi:F-type H+-transporting ATPase subunit b